MADNEIYEKNDDDEIVYSEEVVYHDVNVKPKDVYVSFKESIEETFTEKAEFSKSDEVGYADKVEDINFTIHKDLDSECSEKISKKPETEPQIIYSISTETHDIQIDNLVISTIEVSPDQDISLQDEVVARKVEIVELDSGDIELREVEDDYCKVDVSKSGIEQKIKSIIPEINKVVSSGSFQIDEHIKNENFEDRKREEKAQKASKKLDEEDDEETIEVFMDAVESVDQKIHITDKKELHIIESEVGEIEITEVATALSSPDESEAKEGKLEFEPAIVDTYSIEQKLTTSVEFELKEDLDQCLKALKEPIQIIEEAHLEKEPICEKKDEAEVDELPQQSIPVIVDDTKDEENEVYQDTLSSPWKTLEATKDSVDEVSKKEPKIEQIIQNVIEKAVHIVEESEKKEELSCDDSKVESKVDETHIININLVFVSSTEDKIIEKEKLESNTNFETEETDKFQQNDEGVRKTIEKDTKEESSILFDFPSQVNAEKIPSEAKSDFKDKTRKTEKDEIEQESLIETVLYTETPKEQKSTKDDGVLQQKIGEQTESEKKVADEYITIETEEIQISSIPKAAIAVDISPTIEIQKDDVSKQNVANEHDNSKQTKQKIDEIDKVQEKLSFSTEFLVSESSQTKEAQEVKQDTSDSTVSGYSVIAFTKSSHEPQTNEAFELNEPKKKEDKDTQEIVEIEVEQKSSEQDTPKKYTESSAPKSETIMIVDTEKIISNDKTLVYPKQKDQDAEEFSFAQKFEERKSSLVLEEVPHSSSSLVEAEKLSRNTKISVKTKVRMERSIGPDGEIKETLITESFEDDNQLDLISPKSSLSDETENAEKTPETELSSHPVMVYTETIETEPDVAYETSEYHETLPDGTNVKRTVSQTTRKTTMTKKFFLETSAEQEKYSFIKKRENSQEDVTKKEDEVHISRFTDRHEESPTKIVESEVTEKVTDGKPVKVIKTKTSSQLLTSERTIMNVAGSLSTLSKTEELSELVKHFEGIKGLLNE